MVAAQPPADLSRAEVDQHATRCPDLPVAAQMAAAILAAKEAGDTLGGSIDLRITGLPVGLGEPVFGKVKALLAQAFSSVGATTGVWWGPPDLLASISRPGSQFHGEPESYGGIQGGLTNGEPLTARVLFKPPATLGSIAKSGRHDPCILPRAVPVLEAMASLVIADLWLEMLARPHRA
jgi:chorismate synthase